MTTGYLLIIIFGALAILLIYATKRGWVSWRGGHGIATLTAFHDLQPKEKQQAIEYVIEEAAGKEMESRENGGKKYDPLRRFGPEGDKEIKQ